MDAPLKVEMEVISPPVSFQDSLRALLSEGRRFGRESLRQVPYLQLSLCCTGAAGSAACLPRLVRLEKERRLGRFVSLAPDDLSRSERWLKAEGMYGDVVAEISSRSSPDWERLKPRQRAVAKLLCLYNHLDDPEERILEAVEYIQQSAGDGVDPMLCSGICSRLVDTGRRLLGTTGDGRPGIGPNEFREGVWQCMEGLLDTLPQEEQELLLRERIRGYSCTSDCFRSI
jgi:hypothetical protein